MYVWHSSLWRTSSSYLCRTSLLLPPLPSIPALTTWSELELLFFLPDTASLALVMSQNWTLPLSILERFQAKICMRKNQEWWKRISSFWGWIWNDLKPDLLPTFKPPTAWKALPALREIKQWLTTERSRDLRMGPEDVGVLVPATLAHSFVMS